MAGNNEVAAPRVSDGPPVNRPSPSSTSLSSASETQESQSSGSSISDGSQSRGSRRSRVLPNPEPQFPFCAESQQSRPQESRSTATGISSPQKSHQSRPWSFLKELPRRSPREKLVYGSALVAGLAVVGFIASRKDSADPQGIKEYLCENVGCELMALILKKRYGPDICENFFGAVCAADYSDNKTDLNGGDIVSEISRLDEVEENMFKEKLVQYAVPSKRPPNLTGNILDSEMQMGKFFLSCTDRDGSADDAREFFVRFLDDLGIPMEHTGSQQYLSMFSAMVRLSLIWGIDNPLLYVELRPMRGTRHYLTLMRTFHKNFDFNTINVTLRRKRRQVNEELIPTTDEMRDKFLLFLNVTHEGYRDNATFFSELTSDIRVVTTIFSKKPDELKAEDLRDMVLDYLAVEKFLVWRQSLASRARDAPPLRYTFDARESFDDMKWRRAISYGVRQHLDLSQDTEIYVHRPDICKDMATLLLDPRFHRPFRHFIHFWLLKKFRPWMGRLAEGESCEAHGGCDYLKEDKERFCFRKVSKGTLLVNIQGGLGFGIPCSLEARAFPSYRSRKCDACLRYGLWIVQLIRIYSGSLHSRTW